MENIFKDNNITYEILSKTEVRVKSVFRELVDCEIPATVTHNNMSYAVTGICWNSVFSFLLKSVTLPNSILHIDKEPFFNYYAPEMFHISPDNPNFCVIDNVVFSKDRTRLILYVNNKPQSSYTVPDGVVVIEEHAFGTHCEQLKEIILPETLKSIGNYAFRYCFGLTSVRFPESLESLGDHVFQNCIGLTSIVFTKSLCHIGARVCTGCHITVHPDNPYYYSIDDVLFNKNKTCLITCFEDKTSYVVPDGVTHIENRAFADDFDLESVTFPSTLVHIGDYAFVNCYKLTSLEFPDSLKHIGDYAFHDCSALSSLTLPKLLKCINKGTFSCCYGLTSIIFTDSLTTIRSKAFENCYSLKHVKFPISLVKLDNDVFVGCDNLECFVIPFENAAFCSVDGILFNSYKTTLLIYPPNRYGKSYTVPDCVKYIGDYAFYNCNKLKKIILPSSLTYIGECAFEQCISLKSMTLPDSLKFIGDRAFDYCELWKFEGLPKSLEHIGKYAFFCCAKIGNVTLPESLMFIGEMAFGGYKSLKKIVSYLTKKTTVGYKAFFYVAENCTLILHHDIELNEECWKVDKIKRVDLNFDND